MVRIVDLRSDTITKPSPEMWEAVKGLTNEKLGDDVFKEDPTVNALEERATKMTGKEAALFVTSGAQGNLISILSHTKPGDEILLDEWSHIYYYEVGGTAFIGGLMTRTYKSKKGIIPIDSLSKLLRPRNDIHQPWTTLLSVENTHNKHGGTILPPDYLGELREFTKSNDLLFHMDGARIFNAAVAMNLPVSEFSKSVDSMMFCLSKGLCSPIGSIIVGSQEFIDKARKHRKMVGGGWRQAGIIASMGLISLEDKWIARLSEDHKHAKILAKDLMSSKVSIKEPETNILMLECPLDTKMDKLMEKIRKAGIYAFNMDNKIRLVTHYGISEDDINFTVETLQTVFDNFFR